MQLTMSWLIHISTYTGLETSVSHKIQINKYFHIKRILSLLPPTLSFKSANSLISNCISSLPNRDISSKLNLHFSNDFLLKI
jgi:hypothetical protein